MQLDFSVLTERDLKTRKWWIMSYLIFSGIFLFLATLGSIIFIVTSENVVEGIIQAAAFILLVFGHVYPLYYCAYRKAGTALLTFCLGWRGLQFLLFVIFFFRFDLFPFNLIALAPLVLLGYFFMMNWKLRKINKKLQFSPVYPPEYLTEIEQLNKATSQDSLTLVYSSLIQKWPKYEKNIAFSYKRQSKLLLSIK